MLVKFHKCGNILIVDFYKTFHNFFTLTCFLLLKIFKTFLCVFISLNATCLFGFFFLSDCFGQHCILNLGLAQAENESTI